MKEYKKLSDNELVLLVKKHNCSDSVTELMNRHKNLFFNIFKKFINTSYGFDINELIDDRFVILNSAISSFNPYKRTKFSTWLAFSVNYWCYALRREMKDDKTISVGNNIVEYFNHFYNKDSFVYENKLERYDIIKKHLSDIKDDRISYIFQRRYFDGDTNKIKSWKSIAQEMGLSHTMVINLHNKGAKIITKKIEQSEI